ncbi:MAG TPA: hypothetical protein VLZ11_09265 [Flavobacterium sp.]|nr:hypothetical protein [Flavobacterium sp.]
MKTSYLFPNRLKSISGIVFWISLLLFILLMIEDYAEVVQINTRVFALADTNVSFGLTTNNIVDEILFTLLISSGLMYAFSKEKTEDERVQKIRLDSLVWATYFNYILILLCYLFIYGFDFLNVMMAALFSHLLFFIIRFRWILYKQNKSLDYEE